MSCFVPGPGALLRQPADGIEPCHAWCENAVEPIQHVGEPGMLFWPMRLFGHILKRP